MNCFLSDARSLPWWLSYSALRNITITGMDNILPNGKNPFAPLVLQVVYFVT